MHDDEPATIVEPGRLRARQFGEYLVIERLATGGMGIVDLAVHAPEGGVERPVALKRLRADLCEDERFIAMFEDEIRLAARLSHPHVARLLQAGVHRGRWYYAMDLLIGAPLSQVVRHLEVSSHPELLDRWPPVLVRWIADACEGLHAAHELRDPAGKHLGVVHRDVAPDNLFIGFDGAVRVIDFGIASAHDRASRTRTGNVRGKLAYLAPERFDSQPKVDRRVDVWSLGVTLWEAMTLRPLFRDTDPMRVLEAIRAMEIPPLSSIRPDVPPELDAVVQRALERDPDQRYPTARAMATDLLDAAAAAGWSVGLPQAAEWMNELLPDAARRQERLAQMAAKARRDTIEIELPDEEDEGETYVGDASGVRAAEDRFAATSPSSSWSDASVATTRDASSRRPRPAPPPVPPWLILGVGTMLGAILGVALWLVLS